MGGEAPVEERVTTADAEAATPESAGHIALQQTCECAAASTGKVELTAG